MVARMLDYATEHRNEARIRPEVYSLVVTPPRQGQDPPGSANGRTRILSPHDLQAIEPRSRWMMEEDV